MDRHFAQNFSRRLSIRRVKTNRRRQAARRLRRAVSPTTRSARFSFGFGDHNTTSWHHVSHALNNDGAQHGQHPTQEIGVQSIF